MLAAVPIDAGGEVFAALGDVEAAVTRVRGEVAALCSRFPVYGARPG